MKQGRAPTVHDYGPKNKPMKSHAVDPGYADQLGQATRFVKVPMYEGRGIEAPVKGSTVHPRGSQGHHK